MVVSAGEEERCSLAAKFRIDTKRRLVISTAWGRFTVQDVLLHRRNLLRDPTFDSTFSQLLDLTRVTGAFMTGEDVRSLADDQIFSLVSRRSLLVRPDDSDLFGLARKFKIIREGRGERATRVFRERDAALHWALFGE